MSGAQLGLVLDCADPERLAEFWAPALGYRHAGTFDAFGVLLPPEDGGPKLLLQRVEEPKVGKNRMHLDLHAEDLSAEVARLVALGATRLDEEPQNMFGTTWFRMSDPEGNEFCVCSP
ncbi:VOC family protein [Nocardioides marmorisolisilvae]|uniref:VOC family protein n=1 Tax=Nocardioides marmorisolisilvae TaxID=1542737 RepID=A0A3N0DV72_9ACTN|nr:VOC family protein [Nocardioides marmorisolisilvae]RNL79441.1 VOC family protein [Nocardioides marmorisolisilvae]